MRCAVFIYNRTPHRSNKFEIPFKKIAPHKFCHNEQIRRFGCLAYMKTPKKFDSQKTSAKAIRTFLVGYLSSGYLLYCNKQKIFYKSRNVRFNENLAFKDLHEITEIDEKFDLIDETKSEIEKDETVPITEKKQSLRKRKAAEKLPDPSEPKIERRVTRSQTLKDTSFTNFCVSEVERTQVMFLENEDLQKHYSGLTEDEVKFKTLAFFNQELATYKEAMRCGEWKEGRMQLKMKYNPCLKIKFGITWRDLIKRS